MDLLKNEFDEEKAKLFRRSTVITPRIIDKMKVEEIINTLQSPDTKIETNQKIEGNFLKIDDKSNFELETENFKEFSDKYNTNRVKIFKNVNIIINKIFNKSCGTNINYNDDIFLISQNISKVINKIIKLDKVYMDQLIKDFIGTSNNNVHKGNTLILDKKMCDNIGSFLCYCYSESRLQTYKIKDAKKLIEIKQNILKNKINVYKDYLDYCKHNKSSDMKITFFWKKQRNKYQCLPELIFLFNRFSKIKEVVFDINSFEEEEEDTDLNRAHNLIMQLTLINLNIFLNSIKAYNINLIYEEFEKILYFKYYSDKFKNLCEKKNEVYKRYNPLNKNKMFNRKWNFKYSLDTNENSKDLKINNEKSINKKYKFFEEEEDEETNVQEKDAKDLQNDVKENGLFKIIENYMDKLELIIICFYGLINFDNYENIDLTVIINDAFYQEYLTFLSLHYSIEEITEIKDCFSIFDTLICNKKKLNNKYNLELNALDAISFEKALTFILKNKSLVSLNISLFTSDITYFPYSLYKISLGEWNDDNLDTNNNNNYLYNDIIDLEKNILNKLSTNFIYHLSVFLEILKYMGNLEEIGINIDIPPNIAIMRNYKNAILKFVLNIISFVSNNKNIKRFCLISSKTVLDSRKIPYINELITSIKMTKASNLIDFTLNLQFVRISNLGKLISTQLQILNIGYLDFETFKNICQFLYSDKFNKQSCLKKISIGLLNTIINFDYEMKFILRKLFSIKIKSLISLSLYTNIILKDEIEYDYLLKILNNNWINEYLLILNSKSYQYFHNFQNDIKNFNFFIPHCLEEKLLNPEDIFSYQNNPALLELSKNLDKDDEAYWCLKYLFENKYINDLSNEHAIKNYIKDILKYLYFQKRPSIKYYMDSSFTIT